MFFNVEYYALEIPGRTRSPSTIASAEGADAKGSAMEPKLFIASVRTAVCYSYIYISVYTLAMCIHSIFFSSKNLIKIEESTQQKSLRWYFGITKASGAGDPQPVLDIEILGGGKQKKILGSFTGASPCPSHPAQPDAIFLSEP